MHRRRLSAPRTVALSALLSAALALIGGCAAPAPGPGRSGALPVGPLAGDRTLSPFYRWDGPLPSRPGTMLREEPVKTEPEIVSAGEARRILYVSDDARWRSGPIPVSGTLYLPKGPPPAGGWPLAAWAHGTLGVADACAPSWTGHKPRDAAYIERWLAAGFAVVATDYQGLGGPGPHAYLVWEAEGRSVLDAARAALSTRAGTIANAVIVTGQSQGSGAAIGTARIARDYAPEVALRAAIATGVVSSFPAGPYVPSVGAGGGVPFFTLMSFVGGGLRDDAPAIDSLVSERGRPLLAEIRRSCVNEAAAMTRDLKLDMAGTFAVDAATLARYRLPVTDMDAVKIPMPLLLGTGQADRLIPPQRQYGAVAALCAAGNALTWKQYPGVGHNGSPHAAFDDALAFAREALAGRPPAGNCAQSATAPGTPGAMNPQLPYND